MFSLTRDREFIVTNDKLKDFKKLSKHSERESRKQIYEFKKIYPQVVFVEGENTKYSHKITTKMARFRHIAQKK